MIQILVCDKVYVTPEMKRKKRLYRIYFILSIFLIISLCTYYIYAEYDRDKSEQVSQEILEGISVGINIDDGEGPTEERVTVEDDTIVVILNDESEEIINVDELVAAAQEQIKENEANIAEAEPVMYTAKDGTQYYVTAVITIPKLDITYPVLSNWSNDLLNNAPCKYVGPDRVNEVGNFVIIGHNYRDEKQNKFFTNIHKLDVLDKIQLTDAITGETVEYVVYDKYYTEDTDMSCTNQNTDGKKVVTLITCYNYGKQRTIIKAVAVD